MKLLIITLSLVSVIVHTASAIESDCKFELTSEHGIINSNTTTTNKNCTWTIKLPPTKLIKFVFSRITMHNSLDSCAKNYLSINETINTQEKNIGLFCNETTPSPIISQTSTARVYFHSNNSILQNTTNSHFKLLWWSIENPNVTLTCSKEYKETTGVIMSPNYPNGNPLPFNCTYKIIQSPGKIIQLSLTDLHITMDNKTCYNRLDIHDGDDDNNSTIIGSICDSKYYVPSRIFNSSTNYLTIKFIATKPLEKYQGFHAVFNTIDNRCGALLKDLNGTIQNPGFGSGYEPNMNCKWRIVAPKGKIVTMKYSAFDVAWHETCGADYVQVTEVHGNGTRGVLGKHCGNNMPGAMVSNSSVIDVEFRSKEKGSYKGFKLDYSVVDKKSGSK